MYKKLWIALAAIGAVAVSVPADARHGHHHGGRSNVVITVGSPGYYYRHTPVRYYDPYYQPVYYPRYRTYYRPHYRYRHYDRPRYYRHDHYQRRHHQRRHYRRW